MPVCFNHDDSGYPPSAFKALLMITNGHPNISFLWKCIRQEHRFRKESVSQKVQNSRGLPPACPLSPDFYVHATHVWGRIEVSANRALTCDVRGPSGAHAFLSSNS